MLAVIVDHTDHGLGPATASVTVVEYGDFECPYCRQAYAAVKIIRKHFGDRLRFVFRHFPLVAWHSHAEMAAEASEAVGAQDHFWALHDRLFEGHEGLDAATLRHHAAALGIDLVRYGYETKDRVWLQRIREHQDGGVRSQVKPAPARVDADREMPGAAKGEGSGTAWDPSRRKGVVDAGALAARPRSHVDRHNAADGPAGSHDLARPPGRRRVGDLVECVPRVRCTVVLARPAAARPQHLVAVRRLDRTRHRDHRGCAGLRIARSAAEDRATPRRGRRARRVGFHHLVAPQTSNWVQLLLATPVVLWAGGPFFVRAAASVRPRSLNTFSLIALGTGATWFYRIVAMAGDVVNDAPALAHATVGVAMGTGTDVAMESAGVTPLHGDPMAIVRARTLSRARRCATSARTCP